MCAPAGIREAVERQCGVCVRGAHVAGSGPADRTRFGGDGTSAPGAYPESMLRHRVRLVRGEQSRADRSSVRGLSTRTVGRTGLKPAAVEQRRRKGAKAEYLQQAPLAVGFVEENGGSATDVERVYCF